MSPQIRPDGRPEETPGLHEERRSRRSTWLGCGSLACPECDAPAPLLTSPASPTTLLGCPYCDFTAPVREFLTMTPPLRAPRVNVYVRMRGAVRPALPTGVD